MTTDFRALCAELTEFVARLTKHYYEPAELLTRARAALAEPEPELEPTDDELFAVAEAYAEDNGLIGLHNAPDFARAVLARFGGQPAPPAAGEVAELVAWLRETRDTIQPSRLAEHQRYKRAAELLQQMEDLAADAVAGLRYIEESCGRLYGVGWDRVYGKADRLKPAHALPLPEVDQMTWQPIDTAPRDGTEILASGYDAIEIVSWVGPRLDVRITGEWTNREGEAMYPAWWQPLPDHLPLPEVGE